MMPACAQQRLHLQGLRLQPLASHLSALAVLRLVNSQWLPECRGGWHGGHFYLQGVPDAEALFDFLLLRYQPTPIVSPWAATSGFYPGGDESALLTIEQSDEPRFEAYQATLRIIREVLAEQGLTQAPEGKAVFQLMMTLAHRLPEAAQAWLRVIFRVSNSFVKPRTLLFNLGADGKFEYSVGFMPAIVHALSPHRREGRKKMLSAFLCSLPVDKLTQKSLGALEPGTSDSLNGSNLGFTKALSNPWSYVLAMEGLLDLSESLHQRPPTLAGQASLLHQETAKEDLWLPVWEEPLTSNEVAQALKERAPTVRARFRFATVPRNGRYHFTLPVAYRPRLEKAFWMEPKRWLESNERLSPGYLRAITRHSDLGAHPSSLVPALEELGNLKLHATPIPPLKHGWIETGDQSVEMSLALSIAGLGGGIDMHKDLGMRWQMSAFEGRDLCDKMLGLAGRLIRVAGERSKQPNRHGIVRFNAPFWSCCPTSVSTIEAFLMGRFDEVRVARLVHALCLLAPGFRRSEKPQSAYRLPASFRFLKLAFHQHGLDRRPPPRDVISHLVVGRVDQALRLAASFLARRHSGLADLERFGYREQEVSGRRLAAALMLPISDQTYEEFRLGLSR